MTVSDLTLLGAGGAGVAALTTISFVDSASSNAAGGTITIPATAQSGDIGVLFDMPVGGPPSTAAPSGWTLITNADATVSTTRGTASYKILGSGDPGASITGMDGSSNDNKLMFVFRGNVAISSVTPSTWNQEGNAAQPASQTVSASGQATPLVVLGFLGCEGSNSSFSTTSPAFDATVQIGDQDIIGGYKIYNSSPANHSIRGNDGGLANVQVSGYLILA